MLQFLKRDQDLREMNIDLIRISYSKLQFPIQFTISSQSTRFICVHN